MANFQADIRVVHVELRRAADKGRVVLQAQAVGQEELAHFQVTVGGQANEGEGDEPTAEATQEAAVAETTEDEGDEPTAEATQETEEAEVAEEAIEEAEESEESDEEVEDKSEENS